MSELTCFKAYDIRGQLGTELDEDIAYRIGRANAEFLKPKNVVLGGDVRLTSESLKLALSNGIRDAGSDVIDIGMVGTEQVYFATSHLKAGGGIEVTASHNPIDYNGMKPIRENSKPISSDTGLLEIKKLAEENVFSEVILQYYQEQYSTLVEESLHTKNSFEILFKNIHRILQAILGNLRCLLSAEAADFMPQWVQGKLCTVSFVITW